MVRGHGRGGGAKSGRDDERRRHRQWREPGSKNRAGPRAGPRGVRRTWQQHSGRPTPQQIVLNQRIVACTAVQDVFHEVAQASERGVPLNSVNLATALHRVARCGNSNIFRGLSREPVYQFLVDEVSSRLESDDADDFKPRELANTAWGVAKAQVAAPKLFANLCRAALKIGLENFKPQELSNCVWALSTSCNQCTQAQRAEFQVFIPQFFESIEAEIVRRSETRDVRSGQPSQQEQRDHTQDMHAPAGTGLDDFKPQEMSNTLWSFATVAADRRDIFRVIEAEMMHRGLSAYVPQDIANSVWAFVTAGASTHEVLALVEKEVESREGRGFKSQELANLVWAMAKADYPMTSFLDLVEQEVLRRDLVTFMPQELSNVVWAFATAGCRAEELFKVVEREILERGPQGFKSQELANTAWAYAKTMQEAPKLFDSIEQELLTNRNLELFIPQELSNVLWSYAKLSYASPRLFNAIGSEMLRRGLGTFKTQELSNAVWAHATTGQSFTSLFVAVETEALDRGLAAFSPQDLANMIWAFGKADHVAALLFERIAAEFDAIQDQCGSLDLFKAQELSNLLWACAKTQHTTKLLFENAEASVREVLACIDNDARALSLSAPEQGQEEDDDAGLIGAGGGDGRSGSLSADTAVTPLEVSDEMWRYARVGQCADEMFEKLAHEILQRDFVDFNSQHFANIAWAYVILKFSRFHHQSQSGNALLAAVLLSAEARLAEFTLEELRQLGQVILATRQRGNREVGFAKKVHERLRREHMDIAAPASSDFHLHVSEMLSMIGVEHHNEVKVFEGVYHIDVVVGAGTPTDPVGKIAIEVDGPTHFVPGTHQPTPHTSLKRWLLEREGYVVLSVPYFEWGPLQSDAVAMAYLEMQLEAAGWDISAGKLRSDRADKGPRHGPFDEESVLSGKDELA